MLKLGNRWYKAGEGVPQFKIIVPVSDIGIKQKIESLKLPGVVVVTNDQFKSKPIAEIVRMLKSEKGGVGGIKEPGRIGVVLPPTEISNEPRELGTGEGFYLALPAKESSESKRLFSAFEIIYQLGQNMVAQNHNKLIVITPTVKEFKDLLLYIEKIKYLKSQV